MRQNIIHRLKTLKPYLILLSFAFLILITNCGKREWNEPNDVNPSSIVTTSPVAEISSISAILGGNVTSEGSTAVFERGICYSTIQNPTTASNKITMGNGVGSFSDAVSGLSPNTNYYVRAYATNSEGTAYGNSVLFTTLGIITDSRDGNVYEWIRIGDQAWLVENLKYLPEINSPLEKSSVNPLYYVYGYEGNSTYEASETYNYQTYGVLYNYPAAIEACPAGWHLPSDNEWKQLEINLGMSTSEANTWGSRGSDEGGKMKAPGFLYWINPNIGATNESGFTGLPGGALSSSIETGFFSIGKAGFWWSPSNSTTARVLQYNSPACYRNNYQKEHGLSVRCVKD